MFRIASQVFIPPAITATLYFLIFGTLIGQRIGQINGVSYSQFIAPGLIMMMVITNAYSNVSTSLFSVRFQRSVEELLVSPMHDGHILFGYVVGGVSRALIIALLVYMVSWFFVGIDLYHLPLTLFVILLVAALFSLAGFMNGMLARNFDDIMLVPTFVLTPLTYLGGVFYSTDMLSPFWQKISHFNPIFYMVNALRHAMLGEHGPSIILAIGVIIAILVMLIFVNLYMLKKGIGLRE
jgi:ABC-2 type transport system permease protein